MRDGADEITVKIIGHAQRPARIAPKLRSFESQVEIKDQSPIPSPETREDIRVNLEGALTAHTESTDKHIDLRVRLVSDVRRHKSQQLAQSFGE